MQKSEPKAATQPKAETQAKAKADAKANSTPRPFRVEDRTGGDWEVFEQSRKLETNEEADGGRCARRFPGNDSGSGTTEHDGSWQHTRTSLRRRNSRNLRRKRWRIKLRMQSRVTSMKQRSRKINEQGSDGEEVSHEEHYHREFIESKNVAAKQQEAQQTTHQIQVAEEQRVHDNGVAMRTTK